MEIFLNTI